MYFSNVCVVKIQASDESAKAVPAADSDATTRERVARSILKHGPSTALDLATQLQLTPAAVRRHLSFLIGIGQLTSKEKRVYGPRGRGRPSLVYELTDRGRLQFFQAYDKLAIIAFNYLKNVAGEAGIQTLAIQRAKEVQAHFMTIRPDFDCAANALEAALTQEGFVASLHPVESGMQLCQYHCPVAHVAVEYPQLCEAETRVFAELLDSHVQRLATIAHGDGVCTTHIPKPVQAQQRPTDV